MLEIIINMYLFWGSCQDIKWKAISNVYLMAGVGMGTIFWTLNMIKYEVSFFQCGMSMIPGVLVLVSAKVWEDKIGMGDGMIILILGNFFSLWELCLILYAALGFLTVYFSFLAIKNGLSEKMQIPFLPFLWVSHSFLWGLHYV